MFGFGRRETALTAAAAAALAAASCEKAPETPYEDVPLEQAMPAEETPGPGAFEEPTADTEAGRAQAIQEAIESGQYTQEQVDQMMTPGGTAEVDSMTSEDLDRLGQK